MSAPPAKNAQSTSPRSFSSSSSPPLCLGETGAAAKPDGPAAEPAPPAADDLPVPGVEPAGSSGIHAAEPERGGEDPDHWLYRLTAEQWLLAAENELRAAEQALAAKQQRAGVTYARRAAGMALNARLRIAAAASYGRSYMEHLQALAKDPDPAISQELRDAAARLLAAPLTQQLVTLGPKGDTRPADFAARIVEYARALVQRPAGQSVH